MEIALDLDGTLAYYDGFKGIDHIGDPVPIMLERVRSWIETGHNITIYTARVSVQDEAADAYYHIRAWLRKHELPQFDITCIKHRKFELFIDDRATGIVKNEGVFR